MKKFEISTPDHDDVAILEVFDDETPVRAMGTVNGCTVDFAAGVETFDLDHFVAELAESGSIVTEVTP